jgi:hypothetical protein
MSWCLATGSQRVLLRDVSVFTTALPWKRGWCNATRHGPVFNLPWLETARSKHCFPYCCVACLQTCVSLRLLHGVNTSQYVSINKGKVPKVHNNVTSHIFSYLPPWCRIVIALCIKRLPTNEMAVYINHFIDDVFK